VPDETQIFGGRDADRLLHPGLVLQPFTQTHRDASSIKAMSAHRRWQAQVPRELKERYDPTLVNRDRAAVTLCHGAISAREIHVDC
jgi:hypothetical protein